MRLRSAVTNPNGLACSLSEAGCFTRAVNFPGLCPVRPVPAGSPVGRCPDHDLTHPAAGHHQLPRGPAPPAREQRCGRWPMNCGPRPINAVAVTGGHLGAGLGRGRADRRSALRFRHAAGPAGLGRGASGLPAQDPDRPARPDPDPAPGRRAVRLHQARRERIRPVRRGAFVDLDLGRPRAWRWRATSPGRPHNVICVIGDGAMSAGMAYEAMNNAGAMNSRLIVILNDNNMSIAPPVGALSGLSRPPGLRPRLPLRPRRRMQQLAKHLPPFLEQRAVGDGGICARPGHRRHAVRGARLLLCRPDRRPQSRPSAAGAQERARCQGRADPGPCGDQEGHTATRRPRRPTTSITAWSSSTSPTGKQAKAKSNAPSYTKVFGESLVKEAAKDPRIVAITAAMPSGTGIDIFGKAFPDRTFDVGIAEQHAVTFAAGLGDRRLQAVRRDLLDLPAARLRPDRARRRDPAAAGAVRARPRRAWSAPTGRRMPARSTSPISAACPASC